MGSSFQEDRGRPHGSDPLPRPPEPDSSPSMWAS